MKKLNLSFFIIFILFITTIVVEIHCQNNDTDKKGTRTIYLIRHGLYDEDDTRDEFTGQALTPLGIAQARLIASRLKCMGIEFSSLTSSTMTRARETAMVINELFPGLKLNQSPYIAECTPPTWQEKIMAETDPAEMTECVDNLEKAYKEYFIPSPDEKDRNDVIVCHGNVIRYFVTKALMVDPLSWLQMSITNCSLTIIRIMPNGKIKLDAFGDYGHIPENLRTFTGGKNKLKELTAPTNN